MEIGFLFEELLSHAVQPEGIMSSFEKQKEKINTHRGFVAALDQSGGSTPKALALYGVREDAWSNDDDMFSLIHQMRSRIMTSMGFNGDRILAAILFQHTMECDVEGKPTADYPTGRKRLARGGFRCRTNPLKRPHN